MIKNKNICYIVVHCTDSSRDFTTLEQVNYWHKKNGFISEKSKVNIGYHYFIDGKGKIYEGRKIYKEETEQGAAQLGLNHCSIGISLALKNGETPSKEQLSNLKTLLRKLLKLFNLPCEQIINLKFGNKIIKKQIKGIIGHRDVSVIVNKPEYATLCPTDILYNELKKIKIELIKEGF